MLKQQSRGIWIRTSSEWGLLVCKNIVDGRKGSELTFDVVERSLMKVDNI